MADELKKERHMKTCTLVLVAFLASSCASTSIIPFRDEIVSLPTFLGVYTISGFAVGDGPEPGEFYELANVISSTGSRKQYESMLKDTNSAVRIMGLVCLYKQNHESSVLQNDTARIIALPFGCGGIHMTVGEFSIRLKEDEVFRACYCESGENAWRIISQKGIENPSTDTD